MPTMFSRHAFCGVVAAGLLAAGSVPASAQTASLAETAASGSDFTIRVDSPFSAAERSLESPTVNPRPAVSFAARQGRGNADQGIGFGVLGMITRTSWKTDGPSEFFDIGNKTGWGAGLWVGGNRNGRVGFVGEFIYLVRGDDDFTTTALQIPAVFHINFGSRSRDSVGGYVVVGPSFTINLKQEVFGADVTDNFNGADIGVIGGVGVEFFRVGIEGRGNWGLRSINNDGDLSDTKTFTFELLGKFAFN